MNFVLGIVLVLGVMILVHEVGHFLAARMFGVRVDVFSIGFGPRLFGWKHGATDYRVSALPLGGYVKMAGQELSEDRSGAQDELLGKPRWQRALIAFAGPAVNLLLPVFLLAGFYFFKGAPYPAYLDQPVQVVSLPSAAGQASALEVGDQVVEINSVVNPTWEKALGLLNEATRGSAVHLVVENQGVRRPVEVTVEDPAQADRFLGHRPISAVIEEVMAGKPADRAGLRADDQVVAVNGQRIATWSQFTDRVKGSEGRRLLLKVRRNGQEVSLEVDPQKDLNDQGETAWMIGVLPRVPTAYRPVGVGEAGRDAVLVTASGIDQVLGVVGKLFTGRVSVKQLQGVVGIARESGQAVRKGWTKVIEMMVLISVNLGILNLLPIPILDGGHILLLAIEGTMRRDLSLAFKERFVQVGFVFLLVLFGFVMYNDVVRILPKH